MKLYCVIFIELCVIIAGSSWLISCKSGTVNKRPPNILFAISDDQSFLHTSYAGAEFVQTPAFDRIAREGIYFSNCIAGSPGCAPSRSTIVTGRYHWQNEQSGQHASSWLKKVVPFVDVLSANGYAVGKTGKGVEPFHYSQSEEDSLLRKENAAGPSYSNIAYASKDSLSTQGIASDDYFENFKYFLENKSEGKPFFFWYGGHEPHRVYEEGSWKRNGKKLGDVRVPDFLPDNDTIRGDLLDYAVEIEWFDKHLGLMLQYLEEIGELDNTIVIVTSDNGMPFPRAKANCYEYGIHVPLAIRYPKEFKSKVVIEELVSFVDLAPTFLDIANTPSGNMLPIAGESMLPMLLKGGTGTYRDYVFSGRERHSSSRYKNWGYPQRAIRSSDYLLIWNQKPGRWPAGDPQRIDPKDTLKLLPLYGLDENGLHHDDWAFTDIDGSPSKSFIVEHFDTQNTAPYFDLAVALRSEFELYDIINDPACLKNLAGDPAYYHTESELKQGLLAELKKTQDPRVTGENPDIFDTYLRYGPMREFPPYQ